MCINMIHSIYIYYIYIYIFHLLGRHRKSGACGDSHSTEKPGHLMLMSVNAADEETKIMTCSSKTLSDHKIQCNSVQDTCLYPWYFTFKAN